MRTLVVYFTRTGNTRFAAESIAAELGADLEEIIDLKSRQGKLGWLSAGKDAMWGSETQIAPNKISPNGFDLIVIAQPVWAWSPTPAVRTYLNKNNLSGKKVALFFSNIDLRKAVEKTKALMPNSTFVGELALPAKGFEDKEEMKKKIVEWCDTLEMA